MLSTKSGQITGMKAEVDETGRARETVIKDVNRQNKNSDKWKAEECGRI
jgi:hypothetical protein